MRSGEGEHIDESVAVGRREILEMDWLIDDIGENGVASTRTEAEARPVPDHDVSADLICDPE